MRCPSCSDAKTQIVWTRNAHLNTVKRRRLCGTCETRWTTTEIVDRTSIRQDAEPAFVHRRLLGKVTAP